MSIQFEDVTAQIESPPPAPARRTAAPEPDENQLRSLIQAETKRALWRELRTKP
ncbi:MAG: hypothetical protein WCC66_13060 [Rhizobiaceae bacterium]